MTQHATWLDVRDATGRLLFKFDPQRDLVQIAERRRVVVVDLSQYREQFETAQRISEACKTRY